MHAGVARLADKVLSGELLDRDEAAFLTRVGGEDVYDLFYWANKIRVRFVGPEVRFCAIVAAKVGGCSEDCKFCAQSEHHETPVSREQAKLTDEQLLDSAWHAAEVGADSTRIGNYLTTQDRERVGEGNKADIGGRRRSEKKKD